MEVALSIIKTLIPFSAYINAAEQPAILAPTIIISFIFFKGIISKNFNLMALSLIVVFIYGSTIWYIFPIKENMSWEGHLSGFLVGILLAFIFKKNIPPNKTYNWQNENYDTTDDPFLQQFDKDGNFIEKDEL